MPTSPVGFFSHDHPNLADLTIFFPAYPEYLKLCMPLSHKGTIIIADNVIRQGAIVDEHSTDDKCVLLLEVSFFELTINTLPHLSRVLGVKKYMDMLSDLAREGKITSTGIQVYSLSFLSHRS